jgi:hypothetical protein
VPGLVNVDPTPLLVVGGVVLAASAATSGAAAKAAGRAVGQAAGGLVGGTLEGIAESIAPTVAKAQEGVAILIWGDTPPAYATAEQRLRVIVHTAAEHVLADDAIGRSKDARLTVQTYYYALRNNPAEQVRTPMNMELLRRATVKIEAEQQAAEIAADKKRLGLDDTFSYDPETDTWQYTPPRDEP